MSERATTPSFTLSPTWAVLASVLSVQAGAAYAKTLFGAVGPAGVTGVRLTLAAVILMLVFRPPVRGLSTAQWRAGLLFGLTLACMNFAYYQSIARLPLGLAVSIEFLGPLGVAVAFSRQARDFLWVGLAALGIGLIAPWRPGSLDPLGLAWAAAAACGWAAYILVGRRVGQVFRGAQGVALSMVVGAVLVLPVAYLQAGPAMFAPGLLLAGVLVALLSSALPYSLEMVALKAMPARTFSVLLSAEPAAGAVIGWLFLREALTPAQWLAVACIIAASVGATLGARKVPAVPEA